MLFPSLWRASLLRGTFGRVRMLHGARGRSPFPSMARRERGHPTGRADAAPEEGRLQARII